jgi:ferredoxin--NADP+ reductase
VAINIAIVGSGPSGCYLAQFLLKRMPDAEITIFDRLPVPYGLIRYGVAPDHQGTKTVTRQFDRLFERGDIHFLGNVDVGVDVTLEELRKGFDIVALATGLHGDRQLGVPGETLAGVYGAGRLTRLMNAHPDEHPDGLIIGKRTVIVGHGNVAIDVLRLLAKAETDFDDSDLHDEALTSHWRTPVTEIDIVGRSPFTLAKFDTTLIRELARIEGVRFRVLGIESGADTAVEDRVIGARLAALQALNDVQPAAPPRLTVTFRFGWAPETIEGGTRVERIVFSSVDGIEPTLSISANSVITAIGFSERPDREIPRAELEGPHTDLATGQLDAGLYCTGWFRRGARGTIPENRNDARMVAETIAAAVDSIDPDQTKTGLASIPIGVRERSVDFDGWRAIDTIEKGAAAPGRQRRKISDRAGLLAAAAQPSSPSPTGRISQ